MRPIVIANWKMNGSAALIDQLAAAIGRIHTETDIIILPPVTLLHHASKYKSLWQTGAQDCHWAESGAYIGSVSARMLADAGADMVLIGHSERRESGDTDEIVRSKLEAALAAGLATVLCVGENLHEREAGLALTRVEDQLSKCLPIPFTGNLSVAYEPVWAIGTGNLPRDEDMLAMCTGIRTWLFSHVGPDASREIRIIYGGSVTDLNITTVMGTWKFDGALIGGASLSPFSMENILSDASSGLARHKSAQVETPHE